MKIDRGFLQQVAVFGALNDATLDLLLGAATEQVFSNGTSIFVEGDQADAIHILTAGRVAVLKRWQGRQYLLRHLERGACFGEMALLDMQPRSASVIAVGEAHTVRIATQTILELYGSDLEQFTLLQMNLGREISRRLRVADDRLFEWRIGEQGGDRLHLFDADPDQDPS